MALSVWNHAGSGNTDRPMFDVFGPLLAVAFAITTESAHRLTEETDPPER
jgi:hypothetical protein